MKTKKGLCLVLEKTVYIGKLQQRKKRLICIRVTLRKDKNFYVIEKSSVISFDLFENILKKDLSPKLNCQSAIDELC